MACLDQRGRDVDAKNQALSLQRKKSDRKLRQSENQVRDLQVLNKRLGMEHPGSSHPSLSSTAPAPPPQAPGITVPKSILNPMPKPPPPPEVSFADPTATSPTTTPRPLQFNMAPGESQRPEPDDLQNYATWPPGMPVPDRQEQNRMTSQ